MSVPRNPLEQNGGVECVALNVSISRRTFPTRFADVKSVMDKGSLQGQRHMVRAHAKAKCRSCLAVLCFRRSFLRRSAGSADQRFRLSPGSSPLCLDFTASSICCGFPFPSMCLA